MSTGSLNHHHEYQMIGQSSSWSQTPVLGHCCCHTHDSILVFSHNQFSLVTKTMYMGLILQVWQKEMTFASAQLSRPISLLSALSMILYIPFNYFVDEKHSGQGVGVIACHSNNTAALGTLHLPLLLL